MKTFLKNKFIFLYLYFFSFSYCYGKWQVFREHKTFTEYFEMESIKKIDDIIYIWSMFDYKIAQKKGKLSTKFYTKYDCKNKRFKVITIIDYNTNMGRGRTFEYKKNLNTESDNPDWFYPELMSENYEKIKFVCNF